MDNPIPAPAPEQRRGHLYCSGCRYWDPIDEATGLCRRHAPRLEAEAAWPLTQGEDWCGEGDHERRRRRGQEQPLTP